MPHRIVVTRLGGPEVLAWEVDEPRPPAHGEVLVRQTAVGLNYIDTYFRSGQYAGPTPPFVPGMEAAGVVEAVGEGVTHLAKGDRVAYGRSPLGSYVEMRTMPADQLVRVPDAIDDATAAAMMLKGMTAEYLLFRTYPVARGHTILVHAAAGGVGLILCQWARHLGATVIGTVGSEEKAQLAADHGCHHPIVYTRESFVDRVRSITGGQGANVVYDSVGKDTFSASLDCLVARGTIVLFGQSSGRVEPFDPQTLSHKGSLFLTRPTLAHYVATRSDLELSAGRLFDAVAAGVVKIRIGQSFPLAEAARAHAALEGRRTTGSTVLLT